MTLEICAPSPKAPERGNSCGPLELWTARSEAARSQSVPNPLHSAYHIATKTPVHPRASGRHCRPSRLLLRGGFPCRRRRHPGAALSHAQRRLRRPRGGDRAPRDRGGGAHGQAWGRELPGASRRAHGSTPETALSTPRGRWHGHRAVLQPEPGLRADQEDLPGDARCHRGNRRCPLLRAQRDRRPRYLPRPRRKHAGGDGDPGRIDHHSAVREERSRCHR